MSAAGMNIEKPSQRCFSSSCISVRKNQIYQRFSILLPDERSPVPSVHPVSRRYGMLASECRGSSENTHHHRVQPNTVEGLTPLRDRISVQRIGILTGQVHEKSSFQSGNLWSNGSRRSRWAWTGRAICPQM